MGPQHHAQSVDPDPQDARGAVDLSPEPVKVGEVLPSVCTVGDVARLLQVSVSRVHQLRSEGKLTRFLLPSLGDRTARFNGRLLMAWRDGTLDVTPGQQRVFGGVRK